MASFPGYTYSPNARKGSFFFALHVERWKEASVHSHDVHVHVYMCSFSNSLAVDSYMYIQDFTVLLLGLHCGTWDMYPVAVPLNAHASIVQICMYILCTNVHVVYILLLIFAGVSTCSNALQFRRSRRS